MMSDLEFFLLTLLPIIVALIISVASINCLRRTPRTLQYCICIPMLILMAAALALPVPMLYHSGGPILSLIAMGVCLPLVVVAQDYLAK